MSSVADHRDAHQALREQQVRRILADAQPGRSGAGCEIVTVRVTPGAYRSSCSIEDVEVVFAHGEVLRAVLKDVSPGALLAEARRAKPEFLRDPRREINVYRKVLRRYDVGAPEMLGAVADDPSRCYLLLLEQVTGVPLWQVGEPEVWCGAARWLAAMHVNLQRVTPSLVAPARLVEYHEGYYAHWRNRAEALLTDARRSADGQRVVRTYGGVIPTLLELPRTFSHGEFHASNVLVEAAPTGPRIRPVDWETAAFAPGLMDLADLTAGRWTTARRDALTAAYRTELASCGSGPGTDFDYALDCCRLHRAVQWLCWSDQWSPPRQHRQDWYGEALRLCDRIAMLDAPRGRP